MAPANAVRRESEFELDERVGSPSDEAGLGGVGVHDRRLLRAHEAPEPHERRGVARPDFAAESPDVVQRRPAPARVVHAGGIGRRDADSQRAIELARLSNLVPQRNR